MVPRNNQGVLIKMRKYNRMWHEIPKSDRPQPGELYICLDPQKRLGLETWSVSIMAGKGENTWEDNIQLGLFWREGLAYSFAKIAGVLDEVADLQKERGWKNG